MEESLFLPDEGSRPFMRRWSGRSVLAVRAHIHLNAAFDVAVQR